MIRMVCGNFGVTCKLGVVSTNSFSLNIHDFISCLLPFQEPPNIHLSSSIQSLHLAQWKQMEESKVSIIAAFECVTNSCFEVLWIRNTVPALCHLVASGVIATHAELKISTQFLTTFTRAMCFMGRHFIRKDIAIQDPWEYIWDSVFLYIYIFFIM